MSSAGQLGRWYFHPTGTMSEVMDDDNLFSHNLSFLISSSTVMIYGLMQSIRKKLCNFWKSCFSKCGKAPAWVLSPQP